jgi:hypothetical protein
VHNERRSQHNREQHASLLPSHRHRHPADEPGYSDSEDGSDESSWADTGDIAEQLAEEDPLREQVKANGTLDDDDTLAGVFKRHPKHHRHQKRVRYREPLSSASSRSTSRHGGLVDKEAIHIPSVKPYQPSRVERLLAAIMTGGASSIHGLTGKPLLLVQPRKHGAFRPCVRANASPIGTLLPFLCL